MVGDVLVITVDQKTARPSRRVSARLELEVTIIVGTASDAGVGELHRLLGPHREEDDGVRRDTKPEISKLLFPDKI